MRLALALLLVTACHHQGGPGGGPAIARTQKLPALPTTFSDIAAGAIASGCDPVTFTGKTLAATCAGVHLSAVLEGETIHYGCAAPVTADTCRIRVSELRTAGHSDATTGDGEASGEGVTRFAIVDIDPSDQFYSDRGRYVGRECYTDAPLEPNMDVGPGWFRGEAYCDIDGNEEQHFFEAVRIVPRDRR